MSLADSLLSSPGGGDYGSAYDDDDNAAAAKRSWTEEEDAMLLKLVNEHGPRRWAHLSIETTSPDLDARTKALEARPLPTRSPHRDRPPLDVAGGGPLLREDQALSMGENEVIGSGTLGI